MAGRPQIAWATPRAVAGSLMVTPAGTAKCRWFCGSALTRVTTSRVTAAVSRHSTPPGRAGLVLGLLAGLLAAWVALDVVVAACCVPQAASARPASTAPASTRPASTRAASTRPTGAAAIQRIVGMCMTHLIPPRSAARVRAASASQGTERRPGPLSALNYCFDASRARAVPSGRGAAPAGGSDAGRLHAAQLALELLDLVPDPGRHLELELRRGRVHLLGELADQRDEVAARGAAALAFAGPAGRGPDPRG